MKILNTPLLRINNVQDQKNNHQPPNQSQPRPSQQQKRNVLAHHGASSTHDEKEHGSTEQKKKKHAKLYCFKCEGIHRLEDCTFFKDLPISDRLTFGQLTAYVTDALVFVMERFTALLRKTVVFLGQKMEVINAKLVQIKVPYEITRVINSFNVLVTGNHQCIVISSYIFFPFLKMFCPRLFQPFVQFIL